jgi:hypothetical protein
MIKAAIEYVRELSDDASRPLFEVVAGRPFKVHPDGSTEPLLEPSAPPMVVHSLEGLVDYAGIGLDEVGLEGGEFPNGLVVQIFGPRDVRLVSHIFGPHRQRDAYARATPADGDRFAFGKYMDPETFVVALSSQFEAAGDRADVLATVGNLRDEAVRSLSDDGVTQRASVRTGLAKIEEVEIKNPVALQPFRTFADVEQPSGLFVLRMRGGGEGKPPSIALFEVDDGKWRQEAISRIRAYFVEHLESIPVIG